MRVLHLCHNHPDLQPGGSEVLARGLFRELRDRHGLEGLFLAAVTRAHRPRRPGTLLQSVGGAADEMLVWLGHFDRFALSQPDTYGLATLAPLVASLDPDIVHFHHLLMFGAEGVDGPAAPRRAASPDGRRDRFGFFGHINRFKGSTALLEASRILSEDGVPHRVSLHGGTAYQPDAFL